MRVYPLFEIEPIDHYGVDGCPCYCSRCRDREHPAHSACYRETPEAIANITARAVIAELVERRREPSFYERHASKHWGGWSITSLSNILKDRYGSAYEPYRQDLLICERRRYELRREAFFGVEARSKDVIAKELGFEQEINLIHDLMYRENPLFALIPKVSLQ